MTKPSTGYDLILPRLRPYQRRFVADPSHDKACVSSTQIGKTFAVAADLLGQAWEYRGPWAFWWTAPTLAQSKQGQRILYHMARSAKIWKSGPRPPFEDQSPRPMVLTNDAVVEYRTWKNPDNLMGDTIAGGVVDEAGLLTPRAHANIETRRSATDGRLLFIGNPGLTTGPFRTICARAEELMAEPWHPSHHRISLHRWTWQDRYEWLATVDQAQADAYKAQVIEAKETIHETEWRRLYEAEWTDDDSAVFRNVHEAVVKSGFAPDPEQRYAIGVDVGQSQDYTVCIAFNVTEWRAEGMARWRGVGWPESAARVQAFVEKWDARSCPVIEISGIGEALCTELRRMQVRFMPFRTTAQSKRDIITALQADFEAGDIKVANLHPLPHELSMYRSERYQSAGTIAYRYQAPAGLHDDCCMALALARYAAVRRSGPALTMVG